MRILVLSDTHGHLELINTLVEKHKADAVVHCGDFGIESANRLLQTPQYVHINTADLRLITQEFKEIAQS